MDSPSSPVNLPRRPRRRWRRFFSAILILILIGGGVIAYLFWAAEADLNRAMAELDASDPGWRLEDIEAKRRQVPDAVNSALHLRAVMALLGGPWLPEMDKLFEDLPPQVQLNDQQAAILDKRFAGKGKSIAILRQLKDMPHGRAALVYSEDFLSTKLSPQVVREAAWWLQFDAYRRVYAFDADGAMESCLAMFHAARSHGDEPFLISQLVRYACLATTTFALERTLAQGEPNETSLKKMQDALEMELAENTLLVALRGERAGVHRFMQAVADGKADLSGMLGTGGGPLKAISSIQTRHHGALLRFQTQMVEAAKLPSPQREVRLKEIDLALKEQPALLKTLAPATVRIAEAERRTRVSVQTARLAVAAERFRLDKKRWPESLKELVTAKLIDAVPTDPYDGKDIRYKRTATGLVIYSVFRDGVDDGGILNRLTMPETGIDWGFLLWDVPQRRQPPNPAPSDT